MLLMSFILFSSLYLYSFSLLVNLIFYFTCFLLCVFLAPNSIFLLFQIFFYFIGMYSFFLLFISTLSLYWYCFSFLFTLVFVVSVYQLISWCVLLLLTAIMYFYCQPLLLVFGVQTTFFLLFLY